MKQIISPFSFLTSKIKADSIFFFILWIFLAIIFLSTTNKLKNYNRNQTLSFFLSFLFSKLQPCFFFLQRLSVVSYYEFTCVLATKVNFFSSSPSSFLFNFNVNIQRISQQRILPCNSLLSMTFQFFLKKPPNCFSLPLSLFQNVLISYKLY